MSRKSIAVLALAVFEANAASCTGTAKEHSGTTPSASPSADSHVSSFANEKGKDSSNVDVLAVSVPRPPAMKYASKGQGYHCQSSETVGFQTTPFLPTKGNEIIVDTSACRPGARTVALPLGSFSVSVVGHHKGKCDLHLTREVEGAATTYLCSLPTRGRPKLIATTFDTRSCTKMAPDNVHQSMGDTLDDPILTMPIAGTPFTLGIEDLEKGQGQGVVEGGSVLISYRLFADREFQSEVGGEFGSGAVRIVLSEAMSGPGLRLALLGNDSVPAISERATRRVILREEVAKGLREYLPVMPREALICAELTLTRAADPISP